MDFSEHGDESVRRLNLFRPDELSGLWKERERERREERERAREKERRGIGRTSCCCITAGRTRFELPVLSG